MDDKELCARRIGTTLCKKWKLESLLGVGGMAAVYVGVHKIGHRAAIKILHTDAALSEETRKRFEQEAYAVNRLGHPGVVEVRDADITEDGAPFLVMELLDGEPLSERAQRLGGIPQNELLRLVDELCDVLADAHAQGIIHRDIKLDNLYVLRDGRLKVLDFGIAHMESGAAINMNTRMGTKLGTTPYMPPEQVKGMPIDGRIDIFAVGATMFRLIAKRRIHEATTEPEMLVLMATTPAPQLASVAPDAPRDLCLIVDRAIAFEREQRYPDASTMQRDVRAVRRGAPPPYASARLAEGSIPNAPGPPSTRAGDDAGSFSDNPTVVPSKFKMPLSGEDSTRRMSPVPPQAHRPIPVPPAPTFGAPAAPVPPSSPSFSREGTPGPTSPAELRKLPSPGDRTIVMEPRPTPVPTGAATPGLVRPPGAPTPAPLAMPAARKHTELRRSLIMIIGLLGLALIGAGLGLLIHDIAAPAPSRPRSQTATTGDYGKSDPSK